jgi:hypothetical protein
VKALSLFAVTLLVFVGSFALSEAVLQVEAEKTFDTTPITESLKDTASGIKSEMDAVDSASSLYAQSAGEDAQRATMASESLFSDVSGALRPE